MARPKGINLPHCLYHIISRSNSGDAAFTDVPDRRKFLEYLGLKNANNIAYHVRTAKKDKELMELLRNLRDDFY